MIHLEGYKNWFKKFFDKRKIADLCEEYSIRNFKFNDDGSIDVAGSVYLDHKSLKEIPIKFRNVSNNFSCGYNELISLRNSPMNVGGEFNCESNLINNLEFSPLNVGGDYYCSYNKNLISLKGVTKIISGSFNCRYSGLDSLEFCPEARYYDFGYSKLKNFNGYPEFVNSHADFSGNEVDKIFDLFGKMTCIKWINEYDVIQGNNIIYERLEEVYAQLGRTAPSKNILVTCLLNRSMYNVI